MGISKPERALRLLFPVATLVASLGCGVNCPPTEPDPELISMTAHFTQQHEVVWGMTKAQVIQAIGKPYEVTHGECACGPSEFWRYRGLQLVIPSDSGRVFRVDDCEDCDDRTLEELERELKALEELEKRTR